MQTWGPKGSLGLAGCPSWAATLPGREPQRLGRAPRQWAGFSVRPDTVLSCPPCRPRDHSSWDTSRVTWAHGVPDPESPQTPHPWLRLGSRMSTWPHLGGAIGEGHGSVGGGGTIRGPPLCLPCLSHGTDPAGTHTTALQEWGEGHLPSNDRAGTRAGDGRGHPPGS